MRVPAPNCAALLEDLKRKAADVLGDLRWQMYDEGIWTGYLNALDVNSPNCVDSVNDADYMHSKALNYLARWRASHGNSDAAR